LFYVFHPHIHAYLPGVELENLHNVAAVAMFYSFGWLLAHTFRAFVFRKGKSGSRRRAPRLLIEMVSVTLFTLATMLAIGVLIGKASGGYVASFGLLISFSCFAVCNALSVVLYGMALGLVAPFLIGYWVESESLISGSVTEIGWRNSRFLTKNDTYMIL